MFDRSRGRPLKTRLHHWLALLPPVGMLGGLPFVNRATPRVLGFPPLLAWTVAWIVITAAVMGVIYALDNRDRS